MGRQQVTAVFDIGRTNKKFFLFDERFQEVHREYVRFAEIEDEDGYPTEDLPAVRGWLREVFHRILEVRQYRVTAINFSSYGASLVHLDADGALVTPLYNYTKPIDPALVERFYATYGPEEAFAARTGSTDLQQDCINYMRIDGKAVKAARLFLGQEYQRQVTALVAHYGVAGDYHERVKFDYGIYREVRQDFNNCYHLAYLVRSDNPAASSYTEGSFEHAYHQLMVELVNLQLASMRHAIGQTSIAKIFIDGGFSDNEVFLHLLSHHFRDLPLRTTDASLGSALGAAICISDKDLNSKFLKQHYGLKKHQPFIITEGC